MKRSGLYSLIFLLTLFTAACGGGGETEMTETTGGATTDGTQSIEIIGIDAMKFVVESETEGVVTGEQIGEEFVLEEIIASPGDEIEITLTTRSTLPEVAMSHNFVLLTLDADADAFAQESAIAADNGYIASGRSNEIIVSTEMLGGGESETITFNAPDEPGTYTFICSFPGHYLSGMRGTLVVQ